MLVHTFQIKTLPEQDQSLLDCGMFALQIITFVPCRAATVMLLREAFPAGLVSCRRAGWGQGG